MRDMGANSVGLPHYPHAQLEYDLCDQMGIFCWAENGHSNGQGQDKPGTDRRPDYRGVCQTKLQPPPSIAVWSVGNEAGEDVARPLGAPRQGPRRSRAPSL